MRKVMPVLSNRCGLCISSPRSTLLSQYACLCDRHFATSTDDLGASCASAQPPDCTRLRDRPPPPHQLPAQRVQRQMISSSRTNHGLGLGLDRRCCLCCEPSPASAVSCRREGGGCAGWDISHIP